jgi:hypothetical protein
MKRIHKLFLSMVVFTRFSAQTQAQKVFSFGGRTLLLNFNVMLYKTENHGKILFTAYKTNLLLSRIKNVST